MRHTKFKFNKIPLLLLLAVLIMSTSCEYLKKKPDEKPIARVFDKYLYASDIEDILKKANNREDSITLTNDFINYWIRRELMLNKAELNLAKENKNFQRQIDEYRTALLIYKYEEMMMEQKFDTLISENQKMAYYNENKSYFLLNHPVARFQYIIVNNNNKDLPVITKLFAESKDDKFDQLERLLYNNVERFDLSTDNWYNVSSTDARIASNYSPNQSFYVFTDSTYTYLYKIQEFRNVNDTAPYEYIHPNIDALILNKRRISFFKDLETDLYQNAQKYNHFEIYNYENEKH